MSKHTPKPWFVGYGDRIPETLIIACAGYGCIAVLEANPEFGVPDRENGDFIVRACNAHEELLEASKALIAEYRARMQAPAHFLPEQPVVDAEAAIARAEGESP